MKLLLADCQWCWAQPLRPRRGVAYEGEISQGSLEPSVQLGQGFGQQEVSRRAWAVRGPGWLGWGALEVFGSERLADSDKRQRRQARVRIAGQGRQQVWREFIGVDGQD
eukprot:1181639-Pleurochrysis_carterae.AAC.1